MPTSPSANLSLLPWVRQGVAAAINAPDTLTRNQKSVVEVKAAVGVTGNTPVEMLARVRGPGDVVGVDAHQIIRMEPRPGSSDFEPNYFPLIEFDRPDFPWLFTPASPGTNGKLRPWLCLIVVRKQEGITLGSTVDAPLPVLRIDPSIRLVDELPDPAESWAWAHAQVAAVDTRPEFSAGADNSSNQIGNALQGSPELSLSRLICPRVLQPNTDYIACVVPTYEVGRKAGLGLAILESEFGNSAFAWSLALPAPPPAAPPPALLLPVYHHWQFRTGVGGDFESLATNLKPRTPPADLGRRPIDISRPGFTMQGNGGSTLQLEAALRPVGSSAVLDPWPVEQRRVFQDALAGIINTQNQTASTLPLLAPPLYGQPYALRANAQRDAGTWYDQVNLDPRLRTAAAFGTRVVQEHQEALMASAWEQAAQLQQANQRARQLQLSMVAGESMHARHFMRMSAETLLRVSALSLGRVRQPTANGLQPLAAQVMSSALPMQAIGTAMRRIGRHRGPLTRRINSQGYSRSLTNTWAACLNQGGGSPVAVPFQSIFRVGSGGLPGPPLLPFWQVTDTLVAATGSHPFTEIVRADYTKPAVFYQPGFPPNADSLAAQKFRAAAIEHLSRIKPGRAPVSPPPPSPLPLETVRQTLLAQIQPRTALMPMVRNMLSLGDGVLGMAATAATAQVGPLVVTPRFTQPMYESLRDLSQDLLLPGVEQVLPESVLGLETNRRFIEAYLLGLNFEMGRELLWRGFPTDRRGTYFAQFWGTGTGNVLQADIAPIHGWGSRALGAEQGAPPREKFVMLLRSALLRRYPNAIIYLVPAVISNGVRAPSDNPALEIMPRFGGAIAPDITFFGFDLPSVTVAGNGTTALPGYYLIIQEHPTEPRFGLDVGVVAPGGKLHLSAAGTSPIAPPATTVQWGRNSAHNATITRQLPVRIAIHASKLISA